MQLNLPPLRERTQDILPLANVFVDRACAQIGRPRARLSKSAAEAPLDNPRLGNVRQLQNVVFRAVTMTEAPLIEAQDLELAVAQFERALLARLYPHYPSTRKLAERLQTSHSAVAARLRKYGIAGQA